MSRTRTLDEEDINGWRGTLAARPMELPFGSWPKRHYDDISVRSYPLKKLENGANFSSNGESRTVEGANLEYESFNTTLHSEVRQYRNPAS